MRRKIIVPPGAPKRKLKMVAFRLPEDLDEELEVFVARAQRTKTDIVIFAIRHLLDNAVPAAESDLKSV